MKKNKMIVSCLLMASCVMTMSGCSKADTAQKEFLVSHGHNEQHPVHAGLTYLTDKMSEGTNDELAFSIYPNGQLGDGRDVIELVKGGVLDIVKVSASSLEQFNPAYSIFSLPYVFQSTEHYYDVMENSEAVQEIFQSTKDDGFFAIGWYDSGSRSVYTTQDIKVETPNDLKGLKIRTQDSSTSIEMIRNMGGSATPMSGGEVYTSLQQGIIDGAENNETVLLDSGHGDITKAYTYTQHQYSPDIVIISTETWNELTTEQQELLMISMDESTEVHKALWKELVDTNKKGGEELGVKFYTVDKTPFIEAVQPQHEVFKAKSEVNARYLEDFLSYVE